jgi:hypothetical protein
MLGTLDPQTVQLLQQAGQQAQLQVQQRAAMLQQASRAQPQQGNQMMGQSLGLLGHAMNTPSMLPSSGQFWQGVPQSAPNLGFGSAQLGFTGTGGLGLQATPNMMFGGLNG